VLIVDESMQKALSIFRLIYRVLSKIVFCKIITLYFTRKKITEYCKSTSKLIFLLIVDESIHKALAIFRQVYSIGVLVRMFYAK